MNDEGYEVLLDISEKSLVNAEQFLKDAKLLRDNESFGHAYSLAVLGFEELSKSIWAFFVNIGLMDLVEYDRKKIFRQHVTKQIVGWETIEAFFLIYFEIRIDDSKYKTKFDEIMKKKPRKLEELHEQLRSLFTEITKDKDIKYSHLANQLLRILDIHEEINTNRMNNRKNEGFYVYDINESGEIKTPQQFTLENMEFINTASSFIQIFRTIKDYILNNLDNPLVEAMMQSIRKKASESQKDDNKKN